MRKPYRVIVWGPGQMGCAAIREVLRKDEFELVGVLAYSPAKNGKDAGELVGQAATGILATTDKDAIIAMDADCVIYCPMFTLTVEWAEEQDRELIRILESGKNVVTPCAMFYPDIHGEEYVKRFEEACRKGSSCIHGTGENPGFWFERVALTLTAVCNDVESIKLTEYADCGDMTTVETLNAIGFGVSPEQANAGAEMMASLWQHYHFNETLNFVSKSIFGRHLDHIKMEPVFHTAKEEYVFSKTNGDAFDMTIEPGQVCAITYNHSGYLDGELKLVDSTNWFLGQKTSPFDKSKVDATWDIEIEGRPTSLNCTMQAMASFKKGLACLPGDPTSPTWYVTIVPVIQAIPLVCSREPGIVYPTIFTSCTDDLRALEKRVSAVH